MKKIIITILASFIGMSAMAATAYCNKEVAATIGYTDETFYVTSTTDGVSQGSITVYSKSGNLTGTQNIDISGTNISNVTYNLVEAVFTATYTYSSTTSPRVYCVFKRNNSAGGSDITGFEIAASLMDMSPTACGGVTPADPVSDFTIPAFTETKVGNTIKARATFKVNNAENLSIQLTDNASGFFSLGEPVLPNGGVGDAYIDITFAPTQAGTFTANLSITYNGGSATQAISATAVEAGSSELGTIEFKSININNAQAAIASSSFINTDISEYSVIAYQNDKTLDIEITKTSNSDILFVNKSGEYYSYPVTFEITNNKDNTCGKLIATSSNDFTQSPCDAATNVSIVQVNPGVDYIDLAWNTTGYTPTNAYVLYRKVGDANFTRMEVSTSRPTARITGLAANTNYEVKVRLEQKDGEGAVIDDLESEVATTKTAAASMSLKQVGAYTNYLTIGWDANFTAELYTVRHRPTGSGLDYLQYELSGKATSATITGLDEHTSYDIQVVAQLSAAQGGSRTASGVFTTLDRTSCNTVSYEDEESDASFTQATTCEFKQPYEVEVYTSNLETKEVTIRYHYTQPENIADNQVILLKRKKDGNNLEQLSPYMTSEGNKWYKKVYQPSAEEILDGYVYFAIKVVTKEGCEGEDSHMYVTRKLNYKMGVGCNDATELEFTKGEGDKVFYLQSNATIARVEVYNPSGQLVDTPEITKPGPNYVLNIADNTAFPPSNDPYTFMLYDINGRLSDIDLVYTIY